jgi:hypothetical protein
MGCILEEGLKFMRSISKSVFPMTIEISTLKDREFSNVRLLKKVN